MGNENGEAESGKKGRGGRKRGRRGERRGVKWMLQKLAPALRIVRPTLSDPVSK